MKVLRLMWLIVFGIVTLPLIVIGLIMWLFMCIRATHYLGVSTKEGLKVWVDYIKTGLEMNKDFVVNGL